MANAIIMAAGMSARFAPLSYEKPKALLSVKGEVLIERQIRQLHEVGITDITVVVGYMADQFEYLKGLFGVDLVFNPDYNRYNNSATLMCVLDRLADTYICSSDNYFAENVFEKAVDRSYYAATFFSGKTNEWGLVTDETGLIVGIDHSPVDRWCMMGHAYFAEPFSKAFRPILATEFADETVRNGYWEDVYERHLSELPMFIRKYDSSVIREFDSLEDLRLFDSTYVTCTGSKIFRGIAQRLGCAEKDLVQVIAIKNGVCAHSFSFECHGKKYLYSHDDGVVQEICS